MELLRVQGCFALSARYGFLFGPRWNDFDFKACFWFFLIWVYKGTYMYVYMCIYI